MDSFIWLMGIVGLAALTIFLTIGFVETIRQVWRNKKAIEENKKDARYSDDFLQEKLIKIKSDIWKLQSPPPAIKKKRK